MERIMTLDDEDIIRLIAKSVDVETSRVRLGMKADVVLDEDISDEDDDDETEGLTWCNASFKIYAKIELPVTQIDGTPAEFVKLDEDEPVDGEDGEDNE